jgi:hypothetical protein
VSVLSDFSQASVRFARISTLGAVALGTILTTSACSPGDSNSTGSYKVPNVLCNIDLDSTLVSPFLPGGDDVAVVSASPNGGTKRCDVAIDGDSAVRLTHTWWGGKETVATVAAAYDKMKDGQVSKDGHFLHSGTGGVGKVNFCTSADHPGQDLFAVVQVFTPDRDDPDAMQNLVKAYTAALGKSNACD